MPSASAERRIALLDVSDETAVALVELDRVKEEVENIDAPGVLDRIERAQEALRRLQGRVLDLLAASG
ncbi:MAG TPA: hypothetical protein VNN79_04710 [Actinomycetota bacterium]|nr:hypothetical protein [Actinomycetota bacterium]